MNDKANLHDFVNHNSDNPDPWIQGDLDVLLPPELGQLWEKQQRDLNEPMNSNSSENSGDGNVTLDSREVIVAASIIAQIKTLFVDTEIVKEKYVRKLISKEDFSYQKVCVRDLEKIIKASGLIIASYLICFISSGALNRKIDKFCSQELIDKLRWGVLKRTMAFMCKRLDDETVDHSKKCYWAEYFKYKFCAFYAYHLGQISQLPEVPKGMEGDHPGIIVGGKYGRAVFGLRHRDYGMFNCLVETVNYLKKGMPSVPETFVNAKVDETRIHLTNPNIVEYGIAKNQMNWNMIRPYDTTDAIRESIKTTEEVFRNVKSYSYRDLVKPFVGSTSSCFEKSKQKGGQAIATAGFVDEERVFFPDEPLKVRPIQAQGYGKLPVTYGVESRTEREYLEDMFVRHNDLLERETLMGASWDSEVLDTWFVGFYWRTWHRAVESVNSAMPLGLSEPLKVRVIMKGNADKYFVLKPFQKWMHTHMREHPNLRAIGEPIDQDMINDFFGSPLEDTEFVNGDYQQSTNLIYSVISNAIGNTLVDIFLRNFIDLDLCLEQDPKYCENLRKMVIDCLTKHVITWKTKSKGADGKVTWETHTADQCTGQSMGSPVSFPVLCLANLAGARLSMFIREGRYRSLGRGLKVWVNGDDVTLKSKVGIFSIWVEIMALFGLFTSMGKTFPSCPTDKVHFIMLNSMRFDWDATWKVYKLVEYINFGVLLGYKKSSEKGNGLTEKLVFELPSLQSDLLRRAPAHMEDILNRIFISHHRKTLDEFDIPWTLPTWLGGLGLKCTKSFPLSDLDRRQATFIKRSYNDLNPKNIKAETPWWMWKSCLRRMDGEEFPERNNFLYADHPIYGGSVNLEESEDSFMDRFVVAEFYGIVNKVLDIKKRLRDGMDRLTKEGKVVKKDFLLHINAESESDDSQVTLNDLVDIGDEVCTLPSCFRQESFWSPRRDDELFDGEMAVTDGKKILRYNEKLFKRVRKSLLTDRFLNYLPMDDADLVTEIKKFPVPLFHVVRT